MEKPTAVEIRCGLIGGMHQGLTLLSLGVVEDLFVAMLAQPVVRRSFLSPTAARQFCAPTSSLGQKPDTLRGS